MEEIIKIRELFEEIDILQYSYKEGAEQKTDEILIQLQTLVLTYYEKSNNCKGLEVLKPRFFDILVPMVDYDFCDKNAVKLLEILQFDFRAYIEESSRKSTTTTQPPHFNSPQSKEELTKIFQRLKEHGFFDDSADLETWLYICGVGDLNGDFRPLNWIGDRQLLGLAITKLFDNDKRRYWAITMKVFLAGGDVITKEIIDGMKNSVSKLVNDWKNDTSAATLILSIIAGD